MYYFQYFLLPWLLSVARAQDIESLPLARIFEIFGTPPPSGNLVVTNAPPDQKSVQPIDKAVITDSLEEPCICVPYHMCVNGVVVDDPNTTGSNVITARLNDACQGSAEICCTKKEVVSSVPKGCGYRNPKGLNLNVVGGSGQEAQFGEFPWVVALLGAKDSEMFYFGVGALIHPQVVLTVAHNAANFSENPGRIIVRAGEWNVRSDLERLRHQNKFVKEVYLHTDYSVVMNDLALLLLEEPMQLNAHINVICMPEQGEDFSRHKACITNGWGKNSFGSDNFTEILKRVEVDMVDSARCQDLLKRTRLGWRFKLHPSHVCAGGVERKDTCQGDGGAPLACPVGGGRYKVAGLVVGGIGCDQDTPALYTNVPMFRKLVDDKMAAWGLDISGYKI